MSSYVITVIGIPVYYHYCGGELEEINYVLKGSSCCGGEEDDSEEADNDCCKDENLVLKSNIDFTFKDLHSYAFVKSFSDVFYISLPFSVVFDTHTPTLTSTFANAPPKLQIAGIVSTSVLRI